MHTPIGVQYYASTTCLHKIYMVDEWGPTKYIATRFAVTAVNQFLKLT